MSIEGIRIEEVNKKVAQYWRVSVTEETTSTQGVLAAEHSITNVLLAEYQSAGRGRLDRSFIVPPRKGLTFSFYLPATNDFGWIPLITGLAVADAINNYIKSDIVTIKWPNDLQINGKKLAGILAEKISDGVVVGVGINIFQNKDELPIESAISLSMIKEIDRSELFSEILNSLGSAFENLESLKNRYRARCDTIGKMVKVELPGGEILEDSAIGISGDGSLLLKTREVTVGDVVHLR